MANISDLKFFIGVVAKIANSKSPLAKGAFLWKAHRTTNLVAAKYCHLISKCTRYVRYLPARFLGGSGGGLCKLSMLDVPTPEDEHVSVLEKVSWLVVTCIVFEYMAEAALFVSCAPQVWSPVPNTPAVVVLLLLLDVEKPWALYDVFITVRFTTLEDSVRISPSPNKLSYWECTWPRSDLLVFNVRLVTFVLSGEEGTMPLPNWAVNCSNNEPLVCMLEVNSFILFAKSLNNCESWPEGNNIWKLSYVDDLSCCCCCCCAPMLLLCVGVVAWLLDCDCAFSVRLSLSRSSEEAALGAELILLEGDWLSGVVLSGLTVRGLGSCAIPPPLNTDRCAASCCDWLPSLFLTGSGGGVSSFSFGKPPLALTITPLKLQKQPQWHSSRVQVQFKTTAWNDTFQEKCMSMKMTKTWRLDTRHLLWQPGTVFGEKENCSRTQNTDFELWDVCSISVKQQTEQNDRNKYVRLLDKRRRITRW